jgi:hypothetical protein
VGRTPHPDDGLGCGPRIIGRDGSSVDGEPEKAVSLREALNAC